jgi:hypothetical protein
MLVAIFSLLSGYFIVLIYEYAAALHREKHAQVAVTTILNTCFQVRLSFQFIPNLNAHNSFSWLHLLPC